MKFVICFLIFTYFTTSAQHMKGVVLDRFNDQPIENVNIYFKKYNKGTKTDKKGRFKLSLSTQNTKVTSLIFSHISYNSKTILLRKNLKTDTIYLDQKDRILDEIQLTQNKKLKNNLNFKKLASLPKSIHAFGSALINGKIYVMGGDLTFSVDAYKKALNDFEYDQSSASLEDFFNNVFLSNTPYFQDFNKELFIYDIFENQWSIEDVGLKKRAYHNINYDKNTNEIYILGGKRLSRNRVYEYLDNEIEIFDPVSKNIKIDKTNPHQAINFESFIYKNNLIVMGGSIKMDKNKEKVYSDQIHLYDLKKGLWYHLGDMPKAKEINGILMGDKIFLFGGNDNTALTQMESFDLISGKWKIEGKLFSGVRKPAITKHNNTIYIFENGTIFTYNTSTKILKEFHVQIFQTGSKMYFFNDKIYILGGINHEEFLNEPLNGVYSIDLSEFDISKIHKTSKLVGGKK